MRINEARSLRSSWRAPIVEAMTADPAGCRRLPPLFPLVVCAALAGLPTSAAQGTPALPSDVRDVIREHYLSPDRETRYIDGTIDLNADGQAEFLVYVAGGSACRTGGCPTLVFTHLASGFRLLSTIALSHPPVSVTSEISKGWRNLIVRVADSDGRARDVELKFDGQSYPGDPTVSSGRVKTARSQGRIVLNAFPFERMKPFGTER
jgi:hypothetical protein